jgi:hypothetical protein
VGVDEAGAALEERVAGAQSDDAFGFRELFLVKGRGGASKPVVGVRGNLDVDFGLNCSVRWRAYKFFVGRRRVQGFILGDRGRRVILGAGRLVVAADLLDERLKVWRGEPGALRRTESP